MRRTLCWWGLVALYLALRLPFLLAWAPTVDEVRTIGASELLWRHGPQDVAALADAPPLAPHLIGLPHWLYESEVLLVWAPEDVPQPVGAEVLYGSQARFGDLPATPWALLVLARLPALLLGLAGMELLRRTARRILDDRAGWIAAVGWAAHPWLVTHGAAAGSEMVGAVAALFLLASLVDYHDVSHRYGAPVTRRLLRLGAAAGLALVARYSLIVPVTLVAVWAVWLRFARGRRGEGNRPGPLPRALVAAAIAAVVLWAGLRFEVRPLNASRLPVPTLELAQVTGIDSLRLHDVFGEVAVPAATYVQVALDKGLTLFGLGAPTGAEYPDAASLGVAALATTPLAYLALLGIGLGGWWVVRRDRVDVPDLLLALVVVPTVLACALVPSPRASTLVPVLPFVLLLGAAGLARLWAGRPRLARSTAMALALVLVVEWLPHATAPHAFANLPASGYAQRSPFLPSQSPDRGQDLWAVAGVFDGRDVETLECAFTAPAGVLSAVREAHPYLAPVSPGVARRARRVVPDEQPHGSDFRQLLALAESDVARPEFAHLRDVEPMARVRRIRIYRVHRDD